MGEIRKDAKIDDFVVNVNNADENCTIKCSSGFYIQVAKSCFTTLDTTTVFSFSNVSISISKVTISRDLKGSEANRLLHFNFAHQKENLGGVAVHLYHSTRTIQVQGSHPMPGGSKAALWFVNNVVIKKFKEQAKSKKYAIRNFNETVQRSNSPFNIQEPPSNSCHSCKLVFNLKSKPSYCTICSNYLHKTCLKDHNKTCKTQQSQQSNTVVAPSLTPSSSSSYSSLVSHSLATSCRA